MKNIRTCIACREKFDKAGGKLIRITKVGESIEINNDGHFFGRSCYICDKRECIQKVVKNKILNKVFKRQIDNDIYQKIENIL